MARTVSVSKIGPRRREKRRAYVARFMVGSSRQKSFVEHAMIMKRWPGMPRRDRKRWHDRHRATVHMLHSTLVMLAVHVGAGYGKIKIKFISDVPSVPIPFDVWDRELGGRGTWEWMLDQGILDRLSEPDHEHGRCREYRLSRRFLEDFLRSGLEDPDDRVYNLFTGAEVARIRRSPATDPDRHPWFRRGSVGAEAYAALSSSRCFINWAATKAAVAKLRKEADITHTERARGRALCAEAALLSIKLLGGLRRERSIGPNIWSYQPAYRPSGPGRLHELGLGVQGCPRQVKAAAFAFDGVINYDLSSALAASLLAAVGQYNAAIAESKRSGRFRSGDIPASIDDRWLRRYISDPRRGSVWLAERFRLPRDVAKEILYALMFGGSLKKAVKEIIEDHFAGDLAQVKSAMTRVKRTLCWLQPKGVASFVDMLEQLDEDVFAHISRSGIFKRPRIAR